MNDYTRTPNFQLYKPEVNADYDLWGDHLNANADIIDGLMQTSQATLGDTPPDDPRPGQFWFDTVNAQLFVWDVDPTSSQWTIATAQNSAALVSDLPPVNPTPGQFWFDSVNPQLYVWLVDPTGPGQWVVAVSAAQGPQGPPGPPGGLGEAPNDGFAYGRLSAAWSKVLPLTGGTVSGLTTFSAGLNSGGNQTFAQSGTTQINLAFQGNAHTTWGLIRDATSSGIANEALGFGLGAYTDTGAFNDYLWHGIRASGPTGQGGPYFDNMSPYDMQRARAVVPGGTFGNNVTLNSADVQPITTLAANPLATTSGSPVVVISWPGCGTSSGVFLTGGWECWVNLLGVVTVGGITPTGWLVGTRVDNDHFSVTWTSNATSTVAAGGGSVVTVQPSFASAADKFAVTMTSGGGGYSIGQTRLYTANPAFYQATATPGATGKQFQQEWRVIVGPHDLSAPNTNRWGLVGTEFDLINRGPDAGYSPDLPAASNPSIGLWFGPIKDIPSWADGGGTISSNWNTVYTVKGNYGVVGTYNGFSVQANALVGAANDPTGHGGVGFMAFGAYLYVRGSDGITTTAGTSRVTFTIGTYTQGQVNGNSVYIPRVDTLHGVTYGGASYAISNLTATTFDIIGTGTASATGPGGAAAQFIALANLVPYAPMEFQGSFKHGISTTNFRSEDGSIIHTQPGNGIVWDDGTGTASITGVTVSLGVIGVQLTGRVGFNGTAPVAKPTVTGAKGSNTALASLLTALAAYGLVTDSTTA